VGRVVTQDELAEVRERARADHRRFVFTNGCFDLLHRGHVACLERARGLGDLLAVGVNSDASVRKIKGHLRPLVPEEDRAHVLAALAAVDYVTLFDEETPESLIRRLVPDVLVKGGDYRTGTVVGREVVEAAGGRVVIVDLMQGRSTRSVIRLILDRYGAARGPQDPPRSGS